MRHKHNKLLEVQTWVKKRSVFVRGQLTSLVKHGKVTTTCKRAKVLKAEADHFFSRLVGYFDKYENEKDAQRECIRYVKSMIYGNEDGKKVMNIWLPKYREAGNKSSFVADYKLWFRAGDGAPEVLVKLL